MNRTCWRRASLLDRVWSGSVEWADSRAGWMSRTTVVPLQNMGSRRKTQLAWHLQRRLALPLSFSLSFFCEAQGAVHSPQRTGAHGNAGFPRLKRLSKTSSSSSEIEESMKPRSTRPTERLSEN